MKPSRPVVLLELDCPDSRIWIFNHFYSHPDFSPDRNLTDSDLNPKQVLPVSAAKSAEVISFLERVRSLPLLKSVRSTVETFCILNYKILQPKRLQCVWTGPAIVGSSPWWRKYWLTVKHDEEGDYNDSVSEVTYRFMRPESGSH